MAEIPLVNGRGVAIVDDEDYERVVALGSWRLHSAGYAYTGGAPKSLDPEGTLMHHVVLPPTPGDGGVTDHINRNKLDNRKANLRRVTQVENVQNSVTRSDNTSGVRGVTWDAARQQWQARISVRGKVVHLGRFDTLAQAEGARRAAEERHWFIPKQEVR
jgi:HNH endonuclease